MDDLRIVTTDDLRGVLQVIGRCQDYMPDTDIDKVLDHDNAVGRICNIVNGVNQPDLHLVLDVNNEGTARTLYKPKGLGEIVLHEIDTLSASWHPDCPICKHPPVDPVRYKAYIAKETDTVVDFVRQYARDFDQSPQKE